MDLTEKKISSERIFDGKVLHVCVDRVQLPNGEEGVREIVLHRGAVAVIPVTNNEEVVCVRQYRYVHGQVLLEIPAGKLEPGETDRPAAALRELREETGARCETLTYIGDFIPSPAILGEVISMYIAEGLEIGERSLDDDEFLDVEVIPLNDLYSMVLSGEIKDAKTQVAVLKCAAIHPEFIK